jgi:hypothetical protein
LVSLKNSQEKDLITFKMLLESLDSGSIFKPNDISVPAESLFLRIETGSNPSFLTFGLVLLEDTSSAYDGIDQGIYYWMRRYVIVLVKAGASAGSDIFEPFEAFLVKSCERVSFSVY